MNTPEGLRQPLFSDRHWITSIYEDDGVNSAVADGCNPYDTIMKSIIEGHSVKDEQESEYRVDPGVAIKNELLGLLAELSDDEKYHVGDLLALLDRQSEEMPDPAETRYRQFMGLWDIVVALSKHPELVKKLRTQY